jgi:recombination endonuclease VII
MICQTKAPRGRNGGWRLDHEEAGVSLIRGRLCDACNLGLGKFNHDPARLRRAAIYIEAFTAARRAWWEKQESTRQ